MIAIDITVLRKNGPAEESEQGTKRLTQRLEKAKEKKRQEFSFAHLGKILLRLASDMIVEKKKYDTVTGA